MACVGLMLGVLYSVGGAIYELIELDDSGFTIVALHVERGEVEPSAEMFRVQVQKSPVLLGRLR